MRRQKGKNKTLAAKCAVCLATAGLLVSSLPLAVPPAVSHAGEKGVGQTIHGGFTYRYRELEEYPGCVEITGVTVPAGETVLEIPEKLDGRTVTSLDLGEYDSISPAQQSVPEKDAVRKLVLPGTVRPLEDARGEVKMDSLWSVLWQLETIEVQPGSAYLKAEHGILYSADGSRMVCYPRHNRLEEYRMPQDVVSAAVISNKYVKRIVFPDNGKWKTIYLQGHNCDSLESVWMPDSVTELEPSAFSGCGKLKTVRWSKNLRTVGENAFKNCTSLTKIKLPGKVRKIGAEAFRWCSSLKEVSLPGSVAVVGGKAFGASKGKKAAKIRKASYLLSTGSKKVGKLHHLDEESCRYVAVATVTKNKKKRYYDARTVNGLVPSAKRVRLDAGKTVQIRIAPEVDGSRTGKGWKLKTDILAFGSSDPRVARVSAGGKIKGVKKGKATVTVGMKTSGVKCRIKVNVK